VPLGWGTVTMPAKYSSNGPNLPMRIQARRGSLAERRYYHRSALPVGGWPKPDALAPGISPKPLDDLIYHGGKIVPQMEFQNIYLGGKESWDQSDIESIDMAITLAMQDKSLNNVIRQYFVDQPSVTCDPRSSVVLQEAKPQSLDEPGVQAMIVRLCKAGSLASTGLNSVVFNLILPPGCVLKLGSSNSLNGLGGYHGSVHFSANSKSLTAYYSANVFSQILPNRRENGISAFNAPWKNVVATLYHELNEFRTDPDVNDAIEKRDNQFLGWNSAQGAEIGDQPIAVADPLSKVFKEVASSKGGKRLPIQLMYSNAVHGAEGPIAEPH
jgi:hypothetical protein